jgi:hypothetical protein
MSAVAVPLSVAAFQITLIKIAHLKWAKSHATKMQQSCSQRMRTFRSWRDITSSNPAEYFEDRSIAIVMCQQLPSLFAEESSTDGALAETKRQRSTESIL